MLRLNTIFEIAFMLSGTAMVPLSCVFSLCVNLLQWVEDFRMVWSPTDLPFPVLTIALVFKSFVTRAFFPQSQTCKTQFHHWCPTNWESEWWKILINLSFLQIPRTCANLFIVWISSLSGHGYEVLAVMDFYIHTVRKKELLVRVLDLATIDFHCMFP